MKHSTQIRRFVTQRVRRNPFVRTPGVSFRPMFNLPSKVTGNIGFELEVYRMFWKGGGRLAVVRPPRRVAGYGSHNAATLRASF